MSTMKTVIGDLVGRLLFRDVTVASVRDLAPHFRRFELVGDDLRGARCSVGDKVQVMLPGLVSRTYTPLAFDGARGALELLVYAHGDGPGSAWARAAAVGDRLRLFGPRGSLPLAGLSAPVVIFGDETSIAVAASVARERAVAAVFEVDDVAAATAALTDVGLDSSAALVARTAGAGHLGDVVERLRAALARRGRAHLVLTGKAQSIQVVRAGFKSSRAAIVSQENKAYWSVGKRGLD